MTRVQISPHMPSCCDPCSGHVLSCLAFQHPCYVFPIKIMLCPNVCRLTAARGYREGTTAHTYPTSYLQFHFHFCPDSLAISYHLITSSTAAWTVAFCSTHGFQGSSGPNNYKDNDGNFSYFGLSMLLTILYPGHLGTPLGLILFELSAALCFLINHNLALTHTIRPVRCTVRVSSQHT